MLQPTKISLFGFDPGSGLADQLQGILASSLNLTIQRSTFAFEIGELEKTESRLGEILHGFDPDLVFVVLSHTNLQQGNIIIASLSRQFPDLPVIIVLDQGAPDELFGFLELGVKDFITTPLNPADILPRIWRLLEPKDNDQKLTRKLIEKIGLKQLVGESPAFRAVVRKINRVAGCDASVLITGETGTGKELCARAIHYLSLRTGKPFIPVNCGAIPVDLVENELFGHVAGAFTGATTSSHGLIHEANGGTLFLDEVDSLAHQAQVKLLRFLQQKEYRQLGSTNTEHADVRILAASNMDLEQAVVQEKLRRDLYYRLNVIPITLPSLRDRKEDIPVLAKHFLKKYAAEYQKKVSGFSEEAIQKLLHYDWPGNVRDLENVVERSVIFAEQEVIQSADLLLSQLSDLI